MAIFGKIGRGFKKVGRAIFGGGPSQIGDPRAPGGTPTFTGEPIETGQEEQQPQRGLLSKLLEFGGRASAGIGAIAGNKVGQQAWENVDEQNVIARRDALTQKKFEADELQRAAEAKSRELRDELTRFQLEEARRQSSMAPRTPEEALQRKVDEARRVAEAAPEQFERFDALLEGEDRPRIFERGRRTGLTRPVELQTPQPNIELPAPPPNVSDDPMKAVPQTGAVSLPQPPKRSALFAQSKVTRQRVVPDETSPTGWTTEFFDNAGNLVRREPGAAPVVGLTPSETTSTTTDDYGFTTTTNRRTQRGNIGGGSGTTQPKRQLPPKQGGPETPAAVHPAIAAFADMVQREGTNEAMNRVPAKARAPVEQELQRRGTRLVSTAQKQVLQSAEQALAIINEMDEASKAVHTTSDIPFARFGRGASERAEQFVLGNPQLARLEAQAAALAPLIRSLGEKGNLANEDIARAEAAAAFTPNMTRAEAESRLNTMRRFIETAKTAVANVNAQMGGQAHQPQSTDQPPGPAPSGQKWQRNRRTGEWRLAPL